jgi:hypothetical protein
LEEREARHFNDRASKSNGGDFEAVAEGEKQ